MRIYFKTPYYKNSDFMAHLVEHCILSPEKNNISQMVLAAWLDGSLHWEYTYITYDNWVSQQDVFSLINKNITTDTVEYENKIFDEEFGDVPYITRVFEKCNKKYYSNDWTWRQQVYTMDEIQEYQKKYIIQWEYVIIDENTGEHKENNIKNIVDIACTTLPHITYDVVYLEGKKNYILRSDLVNYTDIIYYYFLYDMIKAWDCYKKRYIVESYYHYGPSDLYTTKHCIIRIDVNTDIDVNELFFIEQKKYFIQKIKNKNYAILEALSLLYLHQQYNEQDVYKCINDINFSWYQSIMNHIKNL